MPCWTQTSAWVIHTLLFLFRPCTWSRSKLLLHLLLNLDPPTSLLFSFSFKPILFSEVRQEVVIQLKRADLITHLRTNRMKKTVIYGKQHLGVFLKRWSFIIQECQCLNPELILIWMAYFFEKDTSTTLKSSNDMPASGSEARQGVFSQWDFNWVSPF